MVIRIVIAPDSFKGTMSAQAVAGFLADGVTEAGGTPVSRSLADGGEGTAAVLAPALGARPVAAVATGPLGAPVATSFMLSTDGSTAIVETAAASGLHLVTPNRRVAQAASSAGTGDMLVAAAAADAVRILLGVGGSVCTDGGVGALEAIRAGGGLRGAHITVLCDVQTSFENAAQEFAPQKGADPAGVERLTQRLHNVAAQLRRDPREIVGTGAAGGLAGALWAEHEAELVSGIDTVLELLGFDNELVGAAAVITGEGRLDAQTVQGKVIDGVARHASAAGVPVWAAVGLSHLDALVIEQLRLAGVIEAGDLYALRRAGREITETIRSAVPAIAHGP